MAQQTRTKQQTQTPQMEPPIENLPAPRPRSSVNPIVPSNWQEVTAIASAICRANMAPKSYCRTDNYGKLVYVDGKPVPEPEKVAIAIMHGMEVGLTPMASLQSLAVINGMPSIWGDGMVGVVRASGWLEDLQEGLELDENTKMPLVAWCKIKRRGETSWKERQLTWPEVVRAGWSKKTGPWQDTPGRMMTIRVRGWLMRDMFADVLRGLHSAEEVEDMLDITPRGGASVPAEEPKRENPKYQDQPSAVNPLAAEQAAGSPPDPGTGGGDRKAQAEPEAAAGQPAQEVPEAENAPNVTDVDDLNVSIEEQPEPLVFEDFKTAREFFDFSDPWLQDPARTPDEAKQWEAYYRAKIKAMANHEFKRLREAMAETIGFYSAVLAKEQQ